MRKIFLLLAGFALLVSVPMANAATITGNAPIIETGIPALNAALQTDINTRFGIVLADANAILAKYENQDQLLKGFANANAYSAHAGDLPGYQNYDLFTISAGLMLGVQAPSIDPAYYQTQLAKDLEKDGDIYGGASAGVTFINVGINAGFIMQDLYLNAKFGKVDLKPSEEFSANNTLIGLGASYALITTKDVGWGLLKWRGLSLGSGFIYHKSEINYDSKIDSQIQPFTATDGTTTVSGDVVLDPTVTLGVETTTYTIPVDLITSIQFLWVFNLTLGVGADFNFGKSDIILKSGGTANLQNVGISGVPVTVTSDPGSVTINGSSSGGKPSLFTPKLIAGLGLNISVVKVDVQAIYYPMTGAAVGLSAGIVW